MSLSATGSAATGPKSVPNDPDFVYQWALLNTGQTVNGQLRTAGADVGALSAWDIYPGSSSVTVAIVDTGVDPLPDGAPRLADAVAYAAAHDVVVVAPAGHTGGNEVAFPAAFEGCVAVSSTTNEETLTSFSNFGPEPSYKTASQWRTAMVRGAQIRPSADYFVETQCNFPGVVLSAAARARTWKWGDVNGSGIVDASDITKVVDAFKGFAFPCGITCP